MRKIIWTIVLIGGLATVGVGLPGSGFARGPTAGQDVAHQQARRFVVSGIDPALRTRRGIVRVRIFLRGSALTRAAMRPEKRVALSGRLGGPAKLRLRRSGSSGRRLSWHATRKRAAALYGLRRYALATSRSQMPLLRAVARAPGRVLEVSLVTNSVTATLPVAAVTSLAARADVVAVQQAPVTVPQGLIDSADAVGAPSFWASGHVGGSGSADATPVNLSVESDKIQEDHPSFAGVLFQRPPGVGIGTSCGSGPGGCDHGTAIA